MSSYYIITTPYNSAYNLIDEDKNIFLGGSKYYCNLNENGDDLFIDSKKDCVLYNKFPNIKIGDDMMYALLYYLKTKYKVCKFEFNDKSSNKKVNSLPIHSLAFSGMTWYEAKFKAYLKDADIRGIYKEKQENFTSIAFKNNIRGGFSLLLRGNKEHQQDLMKVYDSVKTIKDFFAVIRKQIENNEIDFKTMIEPWLEKFIKDQMQLRFIFELEVKWVIDCKQEIKGLYKLEKLETNPFPKFKNRYMSIKKKEFYEKQYGGMKKLGERERELYKDPRWIGWKKYEVDEFHPKDQKYLRKLNLMLMTKKFRPSEISWQISSRKSNAKT